MTGNGKQSRKKVLISAALLLSLFPKTAFAAVWGSGEIGSFFDILKDMTDIYIRIAYGIMVLVV